MLIVIKKALIRATRAFDLEDLTMTTFDSLLTGYLSFIYPLLYPQLVLSFTIMGDEQLPGCTIKRSESLTCHD